MASQTTISIQYKGQARQTLTMPPVRSISTSTSASLTEISTMVYGYRNNFCMDLGTTRRITVRFERVNPFPYNDNSSDTTMWSNGKWYRHLESMLDKWQNLCVDSKGELAGGFTFTHIPEDTSLYPVINGNVFLTGNLSMRYKNLQTIEFSLPMVLSRMTGETAQVETVTLTLRTTDLETGRTIETSQQVPKGYETNVPGCPEGWGQYQPGRVFMGWTDEDGINLHVGAVHTWGKDATLVARWKGVYAVEFIEYTGTTASGEDGNHWVKNVTVPTGVTRAMAYVVGAGGGAGGGYNARSNADPSATPRYYTFVGGGGGAGEFLQTAEIAVLPGKTITVRLGLGGAGGQNGALAAVSSGEDGADTILEYDGAEWPGGGTARGGEGGKKPDTSTGIAQGGTRYYAGGTSDRDSLNGSSGSGASESLPPYGGNGGNGIEEASETTDLVYVRYGGNGGGTSPLYHRIFCDSTDTWMPPDKQISSTVSVRMYYESEGGDGYDYYSSYDPTMDGVNGGGGGSGYGLSVLNAGRGGNGCVLIMYYEG